VELFRKGCAREEMTVCFLLCQQPAF
jgi:hypothetical protein